MNPAARLSGGEAVDTDAAMTPAAHLSGGDVVDMDAPMNPAAHADAQAAPASRGSLDSFLPAALGGAPRKALPALPAHMRPDPSVALGTYPLADQRAINVQLSPVLDLATSKAQMRGMTPGETRETPSGSHAAFEVDGHTVVRWQSPSGKSEAIALIADVIDVRVSVTPAAHPDEAVEYLRQIDLAGIDAFARAR